MNRSAKTVVDFSFLYCELISVHSQKVHPVSFFKRIGAVYLPHQNKEELDIIIIYDAKLRELIQTSLFNESRNVCIDDQNAVSF